MNEARDLQRAHAAYRAGDLAGADSILAPLSSPAAWHLSGLVARRAGALDIARVRLEQAHELAPQDVEIAHNLALVCRQLGDETTAEHLWKAVLRARAGFAAARLAYGRMLIDSGRSAQARAVYDAGDTEGPQGAALRYGLAMAALELGDAEQARALLDVLVDEDGRAAMRFLRGRARLELGDDGALDDLRHAHEAEPSAMTLRALAGQYWMRGEHTRFDRLLAGSLDAAPLRAAAVDLHREAGRSQQAVAALAAADADDAELCAALAWAWIELHDAAAAQRLLAPAIARHAADALPAVLAAPQIVSELMVGAADHALERTRLLRAREPLAQHWIAYEALALRLIDRAEHDRLLDVDRLVQEFPLPCPERHADIADFNAALEPALDAQQRYAQRPLDQSLRAGVQSHRNLARLDGGIIGTYLDALRGPVGDYLASIGNDAAHPLRARNGCGFEIRDCWAVRLGTGGHHAHHIHPQGWISSAYYVRVPDAPAVSGSAEGGELVLGLPPFPVPGIDAPLRVIRPRAGHLVLFPSYLWHGTAPIADGQVRVTAPFDVQPARA